VRSATFSVFTALVGVLILHTPLHGQDAPAEEVTSRAISGKVTSEKGEALANVPVRVLELAREAEQREPAEPGKEAAPEAAPPPEAEQPRRQRQRVVAKTKTDADGNFKIEQIPPGQYTIAAGNREMGFARMRLTVASGHPAQAELTLRPRQARRQD
jgi:hypothetical protein